MKNLLLIGYGAMGQTVHRELAANPHARVQFVIETGERVAQLQRELGAGVSVVASIAELSGIPDLALECAGHAAVSGFVPDLLLRGIDTIVASVGALAEQGLPERLEAAAAEGGAQLVLVPGAIAGIDALGAASIRPMESVAYTGRKAPLGWAGTPAESVTDLSRLQTAMVIFEGNARDAARLYPKNANVAAMVALAGIGMQRTRVTLIADPAVTRNTHTVHAVGEFGELEIKVAGNVLASNPKTSALAAFSIVRAIHNRVSPLVI
ncbi:MAG: aspartate dehydrogenase [Casimicrobiaceae bacterium]